MFSNFEKIVSINCREAYVLVYMTLKPFWFSSSCHSERYNDNIKIIFEKAGVTYLVSALTGHIEGSRAFTRYRTIDIDMKKDIVKILKGKQ